MSEVKGTGWLSNYDYVLKIAGPEGVKKIISSLSPEDRNIFSKPILPILWLDFGAFMRFMLAADRIFGKGDYKVIEAASIHAAQKDLRGIYKMFISFTSPQFIIKNAATLWRTYYNRGVLSAEWSTDTSGRLTLENFPDMPLHHEHNHMPYMEECFRMSGGKDIVGSHPQCLARGDKACVFEFSWKK
jgi:hypothetical protein